MRINEVGREGESFNAVSYHYDSVRGHEIAAGNDVRSIAL
jgi:hypothetical protein